MQEVSSDYDAVTIGHLLKSLRHAKSDISSNESMNDCRADFHCNKEKDFL
ncbi:hypothetical protein [Turicimonas muris]|nr:hypothetical protein [Turicimonas muris]MBS4767339.1 hypothetical protein [Burkholderiales bacterium]